MTVYLEYAFLENCFLDGLLLFLSLKAAHTKLSAWRLCLAAALGGIAALVFPILKLPAIAALLIKWLIGVLLALIAVKERGLKVHLTVTGAFFAMTFLLGGILIAVYSIFHISYLPGEGYLLESVPVGLILSLSVIFAAVCVRLLKHFYRYRKRRQNLLNCKIKSGGGELSLRGYADSGNRLYFRGKPVCVISAIGALALFKGQQPVGRMMLFTVSGSKESPVFCCEKLTIEGVEKQDIYITVGEIASQEHSLILHTALVEDRHENTELFETLAEEARGK